MSDQYLNAIIHVYQAGQHSFKKYRMIKNVQQKLEKLENYVRQHFPGADYINYYWRHDRSFAFRRYLTPKDAVS